MKHVTTICLLAALFCEFAAAQKISELPALEDPIAGGDLMPIVDASDNTTKKATWTQGAAYMQSALTFQPADSDLTTYAGITPSANVQSLLGAANYAAMRTLLDLEAGTDFYSIAAADAAFQPLDAGLTTIAGLADPNADRILFWDDSAGDYAYLTAGTGLTITGTTITASGGGSGDLSAVAQNIIPDADSTRNIGSDAVRWANIYADNLDLGALQTAAFGITDNSGAGSFALNQVALSTLTADRSITWTTGDADVAVNLTDVGTDGVMVWDEAASTWKGVALPGGYTIRNNTLIPGLDSQIYSASASIPQEEAYGKHLYVDAAGVTLTMPDIVDKMNSTVTSNVAAVVRVDCNISDRINLDGTLLDPGDSIVSPGNAADTVVLTYYSDGIWFALSNGWADGGP